MADAGTPFTASGRDNDVDSPIVEVFGGVKYRLLERIVGLSRDAILTRYILGGRVVSIVPGSLDPRVILESIEALFFGRIGRGFTNIHRRDDRVEALDHLNQFTASLTVKEGATALSVAATSGRALLELEGPLFEQWTDVPDDIMMGHVVVGVVSPIVDVHRRGLLSLRHVSFFELRQHILTLVRRL